MSGIIFFEDGSVEQFGVLQTVVHIAKKAQQLLPELIQQEREQLLSSITRDELRAIANRFDAQKVEDGDFSDL